MFYIRIPVDNKFCRGEDNTKKSPKVRGLGALLGNVFDGELPDFRVFLNDGGRQSKSLKLELLDDVIRDGPGIHLYLHRNSSKQCRKV